MDQPTRDSPLEPLSDIKTASLFADDSFSKSPFDSALKSITKLDIKANSNIDGSVRNLIKRMQEEIDALLHENAELKSRGSAYTNDQNVKSFMIFIIRKIRVIIKHFLALKKRIRIPIIYQSNFHYVLWTVLIPCQSRN